MSDTHADILGSNNTPKTNLENLSPITVKERIDAMDILRGLALVGILLMNIEWFNRALSNLGFQDTNLTGLDHAVGWLIRCFVEGKFYKLFALLFGMGFAVMLIRAKAASTAFWCLVFSSYVGVNCLSVYCIWCFCGAVIFCMITG